MAALSSSPKTGARAVAVAAASGTKVGSAVMSRAAMLAASWTPFRSVMAPRTAGNTRVTVRASVASAA